VELDWHGNKIEVRCRLEAKYLYFGTETHVMVNGVPVAQSGGFRFSECAEGTFVDKEGDQHGLALRVNVDILSLRHPCELRIDDFVISQGKLRPRIPILAVVFWLAVAALFSMASIGAMEYLQVYPNIPF